MAHLQYVMGLLRLGHDVYFVEDSDAYPSCYRPDTLTTSTSRKVLERLIEHVTSPAPTRAAGPPDADA